jgi:hypothetical protein
MDSQNKKKNMTTNGTRILFGKDTLYVLNSNIYTYNSIKCLSILSNNYEANVEIRRDSPMLTPELVERACAASQHVQMLLYTHL